MYVFHASLHTVNLFHFDSFPLGQDCTRTKVWVTQTGTPKWGPCQAVDFNRLTKSFK